MIKRRGLVLVMVSLVLALGAAMLARNWIAVQLNAAANSGPAGTAVVVAAMDIPFGTKVEGRHVRLVEMPNGSVPSGYFGRFEDVVGQIATQKVLTGEVLVRERLSEHVGGSTLSAIIKPNMRAVTVRVNDVVGVAGFLLPGNRVDVVAAYKEEQRTRSETVIQNVKVLAVDQTASSDRNEPVVVRAVTLEVTPEDAEKLVLAEQRGTIQLALRNPRDEELIAVAPPPPPPAATPKPAPARTARPRSTPAPSPPSQDVTVIRGTDVGKEIPPKK